MPVIDDITLALVESKLTAIKKPVSYQLLVGPDPLCISLVEMCERLSATSKGKIRFTKTKSPENPGVVLLKNYRLLGIPTGTLTGAFIHMLADAVTGEIYIPKDLQKQIKEINGDVEVWCAVSKTNMDSTEQARWLFEFALLNPKVSVTVVDANTFPKEMIRKGVRFTPTTIINNKVTVIGVAKPDEMLRKMKLAF